MRIGPDFCTAPPCAGATAERVAVVLGVVVVALLLGATPALARGSGGDGARDKARGRSLRVEEPKDAKAAPVTATASVATPTPSVAPAPPATKRSFTPLLVLLAPVLVFLAVHGRLDRRDPKRADLPGEFRRFR